MEKEKSKEKIVNEFLKELDISEADLLSQVKYERSI
jgi:hypothetical protein